MYNRQTVTFRTPLYSCEITQSGITIMGTSFGISVPPGDMLTIADFIVANRARLEQSQGELDTQHEALVQEVKTYCDTHGMAFSTLSDWDITDLMRELGGCATGSCDEWKPVEHLSPAGRWYRTVCCDKSGGISSHIWEPFYALCQQWQHQEEETEATQTLRKQPSGDEWCLQEIKAHCETIQQDGKTITVHQVKVYAFQEGQTWGPGYVETALHTLYPEQFPPYKVEQDEKVDYSARAIEH